MEHQILLCLLREAAIRLGKGIENHLRSTHQLKNGPLGGILLRCAAFSIQDPSTCHLPVNESRAITKLPTYSGFVGSVPS